MRCLPSHALPLPRQGQGRAAVTLTATLTRRCIVTLERPLAIARRATEGDKVEEVEGPPIPSSQGYTRPRDLPLDRVIVAVEFCRAVRVEGDGLDRLIVGLAEAGQDFE